MNGRVDFQESPHISLPLAGEGAPKGRMRWRSSLAQCRTAAHWQAPPHQSRPLAEPASPKRGSLWGVYRVLTQFVNHVPSQHFGGSKPPPYGGGLPERNGKRVGGMRDNIWTKNGIYWSMRINHTSIIE